MIDVFPKGLSGHHPGKSRASSCEEGDRSSLILISVE
jgi:hypothetical protein